MFSNVIYARGVFENDIIPAATKYNMAFYSQMLQQIPLYILYKMKF